MDQKRKPGPTYFSGISLAEWTFIGIGIWAAGALALVIVLIYTTW